MGVGGEYKVVCISDGGEELNLYQLQQLHSGGKHCAGMFLKFE